MYQGDNDDFRRIARDADQRARGEQTGSPVPIEVQHESVSPGQSVKFKDAHGRLIVIRGLSGSPTLTIAAVFLGGIVVGLLVALLW